MCHNAVPKMYANVLYSSPYTTFININTLLLLSVLTNAHFIPITPKALHKAALSY